LKKIDKIDWAQVTAIDAFEFRNAPTPRTVFLLRRLKQAFFLDINIESKGSAEYLCFRSLNRQDYKELFEQIIQSITKPKQVVQDYSEASAKPNPSIILNCIRYWRIFFRLQSRSLWERAYLFLRLAPHLLVLEKLKRKQFRTLIVFAEMQPSDNLIAQYFKDRITITMQHGLYVDYSEIETVNKVNYESQSAEYFLAWGNNTCELMNRYKPGRKIAICGKPNLYDLKGDRTPGRFFTVIFDQPMFHSYNEQLLSIAYEYAERSNLKIYLRYHPWNNVSLYRIDKAKMINSQAIEDSDFAIGHTTSMIYELLRIGVPAYKLSSPEPALPTPPELLFCNSIELFRLTENRHLYDFKTIGKEYISYCGEESISQYRSFFDKLG